jgi:hypothetical protein
MTRDEMVALAICEVRANLVARYLAARDIITAQRERIAALESLLEKAAVAVEAQELLCPPVVTPLESTRAP